LSRPTAAILLTGNELLRGVIADANTSHLARSLEGHGIRVRRTLTVGDGVEEIAEGLRLALDGVDLVVTSGGLGPTHDDRTVEAIAGVAGVPLVLDEAILARITRWTDEVAARNDFPPERFAAGNRKQAHVLAGSSVLGLAGTAPALVARIGDARVVILPGVPSELRRLWELAPEHPELAGMFERARPRRRYVLRTYGVGESHVGDLFASLGGDPPGVETSICARNYEIEVDIRAEAGAEAAAQELAGGLRELLADHLFAEDERPVAELVLDLLRARGWTLATAESCTGGMVAGLVTEVAGSSDVFRGAVVAYANEVKHGLLDVSADVLARHGAVSPEAAAAMAAGARARVGSDVAVSVTGVAGPGGGTPEKPVGLVYVHVSSPAGEVSRRLDLSGGRAGVRARAATAALHLIRDHVVALAAPAAR
jgi:competence/damage-inducible protein CinA-like protein